VPGEDLDPGAHLVLGEEIDDAPEQVLVTLELLERRAFQRTDVHERRATPVRIEIPEKL